MTIDLALSECLKWSKIGRRIKGYRLMRDLSLEELSDEIGVNKTSLENLEKGKEANHQNLIWALITNLDLSINWLLYGQGAYNDPDPPELLPSTIIELRGAGIRKSLTRLTAEEGTFSDEQLAFVLAMDEYKRVNNVQFPSWTQVYEVFHAMGYRKVAPPKINGRKTT